MVREFSDRVENGAVLSIAVSVTTEERLRGGFVEENRSVLGGKRSVPVTKCSVPVAGTYSDVGSFLNVSLLALTADGRFWEIVDNS